MTSIGKAIVGTAMGAGILALSTLGASAAIVCSGDVCWHTTESYDYPSTARVIVHEDGWNAGPGITSASTKVVGIGAATAGRSGK